MAPTQHDPLQTSSVAIVGHTGFVGGTLLDYLPHASTFNSKNVDDIASTSHDVIICCGLPAAKWWINQHPEDDLANMVKLQAALGRASCKTFVLVSTIDVYDTTSTTPQDEDTLVPAQHAYGRHRRAMEEWATSQFAHCVVLRLAGLFGVGLKKNIIYDMLHAREDQIANIVANSSFQWYDMRDLYGHVRDACALESGHYNLFPEPVQTLDLVHATFPQYAEQVARNMATTPGAYNIRTKHTPTGYTMSRDQVIARVQQFVAVQTKMLAGAGARLAVSNLAWHAAQDDHAFRLLAKYGICNVELAPTRYGAWGEVTADRMLRAPTAAGVVPYSLQAVFFGVTANLFEDEAAFCTHFESVLQLASATGARRIVFGSPKNRLLPDGACPDAATARAVAVFKRLALVAASLTPDVVICFEPNSVKYGCNFVSTMRQACDLVRAVDHPNVRVNFDTGNAVMEGESVADDVALSRGIVGHVQISMPFLAPLQADPAAAAVLRAAMPDTVFSLEMKEVPMGELPTALFDLYAYA